MGQQDMSSTDPSSSHADEDVEETRELETLPGDTRSPFLHVTGPSIVKSLNLNMGQQDISSIDLSSSHSDEDDEETRELETLLDAFGSVCSLEEIASAYCEAGRDVCIAGDILYRFQESNPNDASRPHDCEVGIVQAEQSLHQGYALDSSLLPKNLKGSKPRKFSASMGSVSSVLGKTYARTTSSINEPSGANKPLKLVVEKSVIDNLEVEPAVSDFMTRKDQLSNKEVEKFLFEMLGEGFNLSMDVIREVLGHCGYDAKKSMDELLAVSMKTLDKGKVIDRDMVEKFTVNCLEGESCLPEETSLSCAERSLTEPLNMDEDKSSLSREVLEALISSPGRLEEPKRKRLELGLNRRRVIGQSVVTKPPDDIILTRPTNIIWAKPDIKDVVDDNSEYQVLRGSVKSNWNTMKAYYEAAADAFNKGDRTQTKYLMEQGKYYYHMAREADNKSAVEILEMRQNGIQADLTLDLHEHDAKLAVHMLKLHLRSLAKSFRYLKVIVDTDADDATKGKRKRLVMKLLERESIKWTNEEGNPGTIFVELDEIDPSKLTFVKASE